MDYLQNSNRELEDRLRRAIEKKHDASHEAYMATRERNELLTDLELTEKLVAGHSFLTFQPTNRFKLHNSRLHCRANRDLFTMSVS